MTLSYKLLNLFNMNPVTFQDFVDEGRKEINLNFGEGRIAVSSITKDYRQVGGPIIPAVRFEVLKCQEEVGADLLEKYKSQPDLIDHIYPEFHMNFTNEESVDVVIGALELVKKHLKQIKENGLQ